MSTKLKYKIDVNKLKKILLNCYNSSKKHLRRKTLKTVNFSKKNKIFVVIILLSIFLIFSGITNRALWRDEAGTAIISRNVLKTGLPNVFDGKNLVVTDTNDYNKDMMSTKPPLQYYVVASSFLIFGTNTFAARLPFAILGVLTVILIYFLALKLTEDKKIALTAAFLLAISVFFIVHSRNARYYSMSAFFAVLTTYFYLNFQQAKKDKIKFIAASSLLFYTAPIVFLSLMISFSVHYLLVLKKDFFKKDNLKNITIILIAVFAITFPYYFYLTQISPPIEAESLIPFSNQAKIFDNMRIYLTTFFQIIPKILFILIPFLIINNIIPSIKKRKNLLALNTNLVMVLLIIFLNLILFSSFNFVFGPQPRFITAVVPFLFIFCSIGIYKISKNKIYVVAILIFILFLFLPVSQFINPDLEHNWASEYGWIKGPEDLGNPLYYNVLLEYLVDSKIIHYTYGTIREYNGPYQDGTTEVSNYLKSYNNKNATVYCKDYALVRNLMFTTDMQIFPFTLGGETYLEYFPDTKPCCIISDLDGNIGNTWRESAENYCAAKNITIHQPFRAWDANRPAWGFETYFYYENKMANITIYECPCDSG